MTKPDRYAVLGNPIQHSFSPEIHQSFAAELGENISYEKIEVLSVVRGKSGELLDEGYKGCNITLPFKLDAYKFADKLTERARSCGAVNTLVFGNKILGDNTDGIGFVTDITSRFGFNITNASILVLGAGGGVRGLLPSLLEQTPKWIAVANRTARTGQTLADVFGVDAIPYEATAAEHFDLVINATSTSLSNIAPPVPESVFAEVSLAYDLVYGAEPTPFMELAKKGGAKKVADGLGMLIEQAAESYADWRGTRPDTSKTYDLILPALSGSAQRSDAREKAPRHPHDGFSAARRGSSPLAPFHHRGGGCLSLDQPGGDALHEA